MEESTRQQEESQESFSTRIKHSLREFSLKISAFSPRQKIILVLFFPLIVSITLVSSYLVHKSLPGKSVKGATLAVSDSSFGILQPSNVLNMSFGTGCQAQSVGGANVTVTWNSQSGTTYDLLWGYVEDGGVNPISGHNVTSPLTIPSADKPGWTRYGHTGYVKIAVHGTNNYNSYATFTVPTCTKTTPTPTSTLTPTTTPTPKATPTPTPISANPIQIENQKQGTYNWYLTSAASYNSSTFRTPDIEGYALSTSVTPGNTIQFAVSTTAPSFSADIFRFGYYGGRGARLIKTIQNIPGHFYEIPSMNTSTGLIEANWPVSFSLQTGSDWVTGMYLVRLTSSTGKQGYIRFIVTSGTQIGDFAFIDSTNTDAAYNAWGGVSLYENLTTTTLPFNPKETAGGVQVSYNKPYQGHGQGVSYLWEYPMIYWLEQNGYNLNYFSDVDLHKGIANLSARKGIIIAGHSEYWSPQMRNNLQVAVDKGANLAVFGANTMEWIVRLESSTRGVTARTETSYKNSWQKDPFYTNPFADKSQVTSAWRYSPSSVNNAEQTLLGEQYCLGCWFHSSNPGSAWVIADSSNWIFKGTNVQNGQSIPGIVGYEWDTIDPSFSIPSGVVKVAASQATTHAGTVTTSYSTLYTAQSGARVFNAGINWWSLGLMNAKNPVNNQNLYNATLSRITKNILDNFISVPSVVKRTVQTTDKIQKVKQTDFTDDDVVVGSVATHNSDNTSTKETNQEFTGSVDFKENTSASRGVLSPIYVVTNTISNFTKSIFSSLFK